jgi:predicted outer membrane repeat protein
MRKAMNHIGSSISMRTLTWIALLCFGLAHNAFAGVINVPGDQPTIQDGIDAAVNGDEVVVAPGAYAEIIDLMGKAITVRSSGGAAATTIDATTAPDPGDGKPVVRCDTGEGPDTVIEGFTLTGGTGDTVLFGLAIGGGMLIDSASPTVRDCIIEDNTADVGGGVFVNSNASHLILEDCIIRDNVALPDVNGGGGGIYLFGAGATLTGCEVTGNSAGGADGGGLYVNVTAESITVTDTLFEDDTAVKRGGAIHTDFLDAEFLIERCVFRSNSCGRGGGAVRVNTDGSIVIANCAFLDNTATGGVTPEGGAALLSSVAGTLLVNCAFAGNSSDSGGAVQSASLLDIVNCSFANNSSPDGAGLRVGGNGDPVITNAIFWGNTGSDAIVAPLADPTLNYCIYEGGWAGPGGNNLDADPLLVDAANGDLHVSNGSPAIDSGDSLSAAALLLDATDLDGYERLADDPATADTGVALFGVTIDRGPYEFGATAPPVVGACCLGGDCIVATEDNCTAAAGTFMGEGTACGDVECPSAACPADIDGDGDVNTADLLALLAAWGACP